MAAGEYLADADDPRVALYRGVSDPELLRGHGVFVAEGRLVVRRLLERSRFRVRSVLVTPAAQESLNDALARAACPVYLIGLQAMAALTGFNIHRGCLALAERPAPVAVDDLLRAASRAAPVVVLERVGNPDNVGGIFRNASALGAAAVLLSPGCSDPLYRKAIRTSMGAALTLPFAMVEPWPAGLECLRTHGRTIVALTTSPEAPAVGEVAGTVDGPVALLLGHEGHGLSAEAERRAHVRARIPMAPGADSLNVAAAAAIAIHEMVNRGV